MTKSLIFPRTRQLETSIAPLTDVELIWLRRRTENRIRFGRPVKQQVIDLDRRIVSFAPGSTFAFVRWSANEFGTVLSRIDVVRAVKAGERYQTLPFVCPGGDILLRMNGWPKVERVLQVIDTIEALGLDPVEVAPEHWQHVHNRLSVNETPRAYTLGRHRAWLRRRELGL
jgi:hypothetical protein